MSTLCKYDLRKGDLFVLSWQVCDDIGVHTILLLPLVARCIETIAGLA